MKRIVLLWASTAIFSCCIMVSAVNAEIVFEDSFDANSVTSRDNPDSVWGITKRGFYTLASSTIESGNLVIETNDGNYGGVVSYQSNDMDFFNQELTYRFSGIDLQPMEGGQHISEWIRLGIIAGSNSRWAGFSQFILTYNGVGRFSIQVRQPRATGSSLETLAVKDFRTPSFNFDPSELSSVNITIDEQNYRVLFIFSNPLDQLSFAGTHHLNREYWVDEDRVESEVGLNAEINALTNAEIALDAATAGGDSVTINSAQAEYDASLSAYDAKLVLADEVKGDVALLIAGSSQDVGARVNIDHVLVETSDILSVLK